MQAPPNPMPELTPLLRQLRLSGILDSLARRTREATEQRLSYPEFLTLLVQDEIARREQKKYDIRLRRSGLHRDRLLENFDFGRHPQLDRALVRELAGGQFIAEKVAVLIVGPCGTGKSHLAQAIGHCALRIGHEVAIYSQTRLFERLREEQAARPRQPLATLPLLILDDFGLKPLTPPEGDLLHELVSERYERAATIVTSNLDFREWGEAFPNRMLGVATLDRLRHQAYRIVLDGDSYRAARPFPEHAVQSIHQPQEELNRNTPFT